MLQVLCCAAAYSAACFASAARCTALRLSLSVSTSSPDTIELLQAGLACGHAAHCRTSLFCLVTVAPPKAHYNRRWSTALRGDAAHSVSARRRSDLGLEQPLERVEPLIQVLQRI